MKDASLKNLMQRASAEIVPYEAGNLIMTDDKAPVELLGMRVIDELIKDELSYYKEQGLSAIINDLF